MRTSTPHKAISLSTPAAAAVCVYVCVFVSLSLFLSPWLVIFTQPYCVTAQIINYSSPRERDSKRGSVTIPDRKGEQWVSGTFVSGWTQVQKVECLHDG